jgi:hypothetical protein
MDFEALLELAERNPDDGSLIARLLVHSAQIDASRLPDEQQGRLYNLLAHVFATLATGPHNALQTALQRALTQPAVLEYFERQMEETGDFWNMLENNRAAPVILALLCTHDDPAIAQKAALALGYTGSGLAHDMLQRWLEEGANKKLIRAAELALPYFSASADE